MFLSTSFLPPQYLLSVLPLLCPPDASSLLLPLIAPSVIVSLPRISPPRSSFFRTPSSSPCSFRGVFFSPIGA
ncbi:hypothetical protein C8R44DRAFT_811075 [Mycena epipterygia]|nr:hypothetical protein C8R44DRAFT_811075 [Mycena epipterygia]